MIKELKNNGYRFMCNCKASGLSVFDMDVEDNVEKIELSGVEEIAIEKKIEKVVSKCDNNCYWRRGRMYFNSK